MNLKDLRRFMEENPLPKIFPFHPLHRVFRKTEGDERPSESS
ncbi:MAG: hypothetical protein QXN62_06815 [Candidatus Bathyarchaeia archaeon]